MSFEVYGSAHNEGTKRESTVDWNALNSYVVETAGLQDRETLVGYVAGIVDLGTQEIEDAEVVFQGDEAAEAAEIEKNPNTYFKDGFDDKKKPVRLKCWPQKPVQCVTLAIDFPEIMLNKGKFFDDPDAEEKPLRLWLGGQFYMQGAGMVVGRPLPLKVKNITPDAKKPTWSFAPNHQIYNMAVGAKLIKPGEVFLPKDIDKLLGKSLQFEAQVFFKTNKGKEYYTEYVKYKTGLGRGQKECELVTSPFMIQVNQSNNKEHLSELRNHVINTIRRASNFAGSVLEKELNEVKGEPQQEGEAPEREETPQRVAPVPKKPARVPAPPAADFDSEDVPF